jgi:hypothetical protein
MSRFHQGQAGTHARPHTTVDHRAGGDLLTFAAGPDRWMAVAQLHVSSDRTDAAVASLETLIEEFAQAHDLGPTVVFTSHDGRRVVGLLTLGGHEAYRHLSAAWDQHHLHLERREIGSKRELGLWNIAWVDPNFVLDAGTHQHYTLDPKPSGAPLVSLRDDAGKDATLALAEHHQPDRLAIVKTYG